MLARLGSFSASARAEYTAAPSTSSWRLSLKRRWSFASSVMSRVMRQSRARCQLWLVWSNPEERPVEGDAEREPDEFDHSEKCADFDEVGVTEIAVGVTDDERCRLVGEQLAACRERPDHADPQHVE